MSTKTKECPVCDTVIAETETKCPNALCGADLAELEENVKAVDAANKVIAKRKAKEDAEKKAKETPIVTSPTSAFARLRGLRKQAK